MARTDEGTPGGDVPVETREPPAILPEGGDGSPPPPEDGDQFPSEIPFRAPFPRPRAGALRNIFALVAVGAAILALVWFFDRPGEGAKEAVTLTAAASGPAPREGKEAPDFRVQGLDGEYFELSDFRGRPVWINFWATWCPPCRAETPDIQEVYEKYQDDGLVILALSIGEDGDTVRAYEEKTGTTFRIGLDQDTSIAATYRVVGLPTHYFVDRGGVLREIRIGSLSKKSMEKKVQELMSSHEGGDGS
jgi:cytochrome c biogenesis protein CcmG, thiol:disulfide interchange protein DsbE